MSGDPPHSRGRGWTVSDGGIGAQSVNTEALDRQSVGETGFSYGGAVVPRGRDSTDGVDDSQGTMMEGRNSKEGSTERWNGRGQMHRLCFGCGEPGHYAKFCPHRAKGKGCAICGSLAYRADACAQRITPNSQFMAVRAEPWMGKAPQKEDSTWSLSGGLQNQLGGHIREAHNEVLTWVKPEPPRATTNHLVYEVTINGITTRAMLDSGASHSFVYEK